MALPLPALPLPGPPPQAEPAPAPARRSVPVARPRLPEAEAVLPYLRRIDEARWYSNFGPLLMELEGRLADRFARPAEVVTVSNATQALTLTLQAMDLPRGGGHVILPAWTFVATAHAVVQAGLKPWFVDVDPETWMLDPAAVAALGPRLREACAVIPVAAFGRMPDLGAWRAFQDATGLPVLLDAAAAFDTLTDARLPAVVSLHATKVLGLGEGGFLATEDKRLARRVRTMSTFGFEGSRESLFPATNAKLSEYTAAVGLAALDAWPGERLRWMRAAQMLRIALIGRPDVRFQPGWGGEWVTSVCTVGLPDGSAPHVAASLREQGVDTRAWWGEGCHVEPAFRNMRRERLEVTDRLAVSTIGLPFSIDLTSEDIGRVARALEAVFAQA